MNQQHITYVHVCLYGNEIPDSVLAEAQNQSQKQFIDRAIDNVYWLTIVIHVLSIIVMFVRLYH